MKLTFKTNNELEQLNDDELSGYCRSMYDIRSKVHGDNQIQLEKEIAYVVRELQIREARRNFDDSQSQVIVDNFDDDSLPEFDQNSNYEYVKLADYRQELLARSNTRYN